MTIEPASEAELEAALAPTRAAYPGISGAAAAPMLPEHLRGPFWDRAVDHYFATELAKLEEAP